MKKPSWIYSVRTVIKNRLRHRAFLHPVYLFLLDARSLADDWTIASSSSMLRAAIMSSMAAISGKSAVTEKLISFQFLARSTTIQH